ncbi:MAG: molybdopterin-dependent oxidoreductase [Actinomycetota bacterium]
MIETRSSFCRICHAACPILVDVENGRRVVGVHGDRTDPLFEGYTCVKGRQLADQIHHPDRLRGPLRRRSDGTFEAISSTDALDEIAATIGRIVDEHGPRSVASYTGTGGYQNSTSVPVAAAWHAGFGSPSFYTSVTIDQPAHRSAALRMGSWEAGWHDFTSADVSLAVGYNPLVSSYGPAGGLQGTNPFVALRRARERGMRLVVVDPRRTELAANADVHLQVRPGEDPALLGAVLRHVLANGLHDADFCEQWVDGVDELRAAVEPYTLDAAAERCDVPAADIAAAAEMFATAGRGAAGTGTGPNMAPHSMLTEHLVLALNAVCGRVNRVGERLESGGFLGPGDTRRAQVVAPGPAAPGAPHRMHGLAGQPGEMLTNRLPEEILEPGDGQVRALIVSGGNPVVAFPDQALTEEALRSLELLVVIDHRHTATTPFADFVIAPRLSLERADVPHIMDRRFPAPYTNYTDAVVDADGDLLAEWEVFAGIAALLGTPIDLPGGRLPVTSDRRVPDDLDDDGVLDLVYGSARMPMTEVREHRGAVHPDRAVEVVDADPGCEARFAVAPADVVSELADVVAQPLDDPDLPMRLVSRRLKHVVNSLGSELPGLARLGTTNHAHLHPDDMAQLGVVEGDLVRIESAHGSIDGVVASAEDVKCGVVSMAHAWGGASGDPIPVRNGGMPTNRLVSLSDRFDPITGMAVQSAIPVAVAAVTTGSA